MDPVSVAASVASLVVGCAKITQFLYTHIEETRNVDERLLGLSSEVESLSTVLNAFSALWKSSGLIQSMPEELTDITTSLQGTLKDTSRTLEQLDTKLRTAGSFRFVKHVKMNLKMEDIHVLQQRIQSHMSSVSFAMQTINLYFTVKGTESQDGMRRRVSTHLRNLSAQYDQIGTLVEELRQANKLHNRSGQWERTDSRRMAIKFGKRRVNTVEDANEMQLVINNMEQLTERTVAYASTIAGDDDRLSIFSGVTSSHRSLQSIPILTSERRNDISSWVSHTRREPYAPSVSSRTESSGTATSVDPSQTEATSEGIAETRIEDPDMEIKIKELETLSARIEMAFKARDYDGAEWYCTQFLSKAKVEDASNHAGIEIMDSVTLRLASSYYNRRALDKAKDVLESSSTLREATYRSASMQHLLAKTLLLSGELTNALQWSKKALEIRAAQYGKDSITYMVSAELTVLLYKKSGRGTQDLDTLYKELYREDQVLFMKRIDQVKQAYQRDSWAGYCIARQLLLTLFNENAEASGSDMTSVFLNKYCGFDENVFGYGINTSVLHFLIRQRDLGRFKLLYARRMIYSCGDQVNHSNLSSALHMATEEGDKWTVDVLLQYGAYVDTPSQWYRHGCMVHDTPLSVSVIHGFADITSQLLKSGANIEHMAGPYSPLHLAVKYHRDDIATILLKNGANAEARDNWKNTSLLLASMGNNLRMLEILLEHGAKVNAKNPNKMTALSVSAAQGNTTNVEVFISNRANIEAVDKDGYTALIHATRHNKVDTMKFLLSKGAKVEASDREGSTPLLHAAHRGCIQAVEILLQNGANVEARGPGRQTALMMAARGGFTVEVDMLLKSGADINARDRFLRTAETIAEKTGHHGVASILRSARIGGMAPLGV